LPNCKIPEVYDLIPYDLVQGFGVDRRFHKRKRTKQDYYVVALFSIKKLILLSKISLFSSKHNIIYLLLNKTIEKNLKIVLTSSF
jgi:hypothetical protein